ncbi:glycosyltransferase [Microbacterium memoriense]|uniref:D-inositol 3-phosphate glycosyltransferase n=1 Tax=Microbacterium memoriense TaxID=2978350 RepID=A0ABT2PEG2_9MICO|nr:glycosyltransferase [Microbacterium memoriense]MCT9002974.1 glycosyltransferase [Microbacterium memoriense]
MAGVIVHEWLAQTGGSENVFEVLSSVFPDADRYCLWNSSGGRFADVGETWLARTPLKGHKAAALALMPIAWRSLPAVDAEWVLTSSHVFAHHARFRGPARDAPKLVYAHTPARYVWVPELDGRGHSLPARAVAGILKPLDRKRAQEPVAIAANSGFVAERIATAWERESTVIYPPVDVEYFNSVDAIELSGEEQLVFDALPREYLLGVSRLIPYKRIDLVIETGAATGIPVVIAGEGPDLARLESLAERASARVTFVGRPSRALLAQLYRSASAVVFPPIEDFGIIPVEAMAAGAPVIVNAVGGAAESVVHGLTGVHVHDWQRDELSAAVELAVSLSAEQSRAQAGQFDTATFASRVRQWVATTQHPGGAGALGGSAAHGGATR